MLTDTPVHCPQSILIEQICHVCKSRLQETIQPEFFCLLQEY